METKVLCEVRDRMQVPGLIGDNSPYSTMSNFLISFHAKVESETTMQRTNVAAMLARIGQLECSDEDNRRDKDHLDKDLRERFENLQREDARLKVWLNKTKE